MFKQNLDLSAFGKQNYIALQLRTLASCKFQAKSKLSNFACSLLLGAIVLIGMKYEL